MNEFLMTERGAATVYQAGTLAYLDSFSGMLPCKVVTVDKPGCGWIVAPASGEITVKLHVTRGGYSRGEVITRSAHNIVPRAQVIRRQWSDRINSQYVWA